MRLRFSKMHSLGEDFVVIDGLTQHIRLTAETVRRLADRKLGVGCQRVILVEAPSHPDMDFRCRLFNRDGSLSREDHHAAAFCLARFVWEHHLTARRCLQVETLQGSTFSITADDGLMAADWDLSKLIKEKARSEILTMGDDSREVITLTLDQTYVILPLAAVGDAPVKSLGRRIQTQPQLPSGANVGFMAVLSRRDIDLRVLQPNGSEATASASAAMAAVIAARHEGSLDEEAEVRTREARIRLHWLDEGKRMRVTAPAVTVYQGQIQL